MVLWIAVAIAALLIIVLVAVALFNQPKASTTSQSGSSVAERVNQPVDRNVIGDPAAPVLIESYEDFQCPHCQRFTMALEDTILDDFVAPGIARYAYRHRFVIGPDSLTAGMATECAADQGKFWEYHDALFAAVSRDSRAVTGDNLKGLAEELGLDTGQFDKCMDSKQHYDELVRADTAAGEQGINSTPTIFIDGQQYQGDFTPEAFKAAVEAALEAGS